MQVLRQALLQLVLIQLRGQVPHVEERTRLLAIVLVHVASEGALEPLALGREELTSAFLVHQRTPSRYSAYQTAQSSTGSTSAWRSSARAIAWARLASRSAWARRATSSLVT